MANFNPDNLVAQAAILLTDRRTADAGAKLTEGAGLGAGAARGARSWTGRASAGVGRNGPARGVK